MHIRKRLFIGLMIVSFVTVLSLLLLGWYTINYQDHLWNQALIGLIGLVFLVLILIIAFGIAAMIFSIWQDRAIPQLYRWTRMATNVLFPLALVLAKVLGISSDRLKSSFIEVSNQLIKTREFNISPERIMILGPHCLQKSSCPYKITLDINNCKECGACPVDELKRLANRYGVVLTIVSGGTWARKMIMERAPQAIVAVACERDLTSGIQDIDRIPVIGVLNDRPEGPCYNTRVNLEKVEEAIRFFLYGDRQGWQIESPSSSRKVLKKTRTSKIIS
ncbi:DUF116 domain-containing protein [Heliorestis acidaminivorans]|uniref:DUF116 domain-containing protein n=1 Tax=Heliorestis acidaminivorans TaxID=553427 RepID=A0A6I0F387_9FIRM|nr:DUF116 domain-containing protein [Heliorestis acidaminivorans]KAB2954471.1 DUF116 domain-containing protein [Heliorestis acidaminivorans]